MNNNIGWGILVTPLIMFLFSDMFLDIITYLMCWIMAIFSFIYKKFKLKISKMSSKKA